MTFPVCHDHRELCDPGIHRETLVGYEGVPTTVKFHDVTVQRLSTRANPVSTRKLILVSLLLGVVILVAFAVQLIIASRQAG